MGFLSNFVAGAAGAGADLLSKQAIENMRTDADLQKAQRISEINTAADQNKMQMQKDFGDQVRSEAGQRFNGAIDAARQNATLANANSQDPNTAGISFDELSPEEVAAYSPTDQQLHKALINASASSGDLPASQAIQAGTKDDALMYKSMWEQAKEDGRNDRQSARDIAAGERSDARLAAMLERVGGGEKGTVLMKNYDMLTQKLGWAEPKALEYLGESKHKTTEDVAVHLLATGLLKPPKGMDLGAYAVQVATEMKAAANAINNNVSNQTKATSAPKSISINDMK